MKVFVDLFDYAWIPVWLPKSLRPSLELWLGVTSPNLVSTRNSQWSWYLGSFLFLVTRKNVTHRLSTFLFATGDFRHFYVLLTTCGQRIKARPYKLLLSISRVLFIVYLLISLYRFWSGLHYLEQYFFFFFQSAVLPFTITTPYELEQIITVSRGSM